MKTGLVLYKGKLYYGVRHGWCQWLPGNLLRLIVNVWNPVGCRIFGHGHLIQNEKGKDAECTDCCRIVRGSANNEDLIRVWNVKKRIKERIKEIKERGSRVSLSSRLPDRRCDPMPSQSSESAGLVSHHGIHLPER